MFALSDFSDLRRLQPAVDGRCSSRDPTHPNVAHHAVIMAPVLRHYCKKILVLL